MTKHWLHFSFAILILLGTCSTSLAGEVFRLRLFFGLSLPGGGAVSLEDWQSFQENEIAAVFEGFNIVDSVGFYKGHPERSKILTVIVESKEIPKAKKLAARYAKTFNQESVMMVKVPVLEWCFIGAAE